MRNTLIALAGVIAMSGAAAAETGPKLTVEQILQSLRKGGIESRHQAIELRHARLLQLYTYWHLNDECAAFLRNPGARLEARRQVHDAEIAVSPDDRGKCWDEAWLLTRNPSPEACRMADAYMADMANRYRASQMQSAPKTADKL